MMYSKTLEKVKDLISNGVTHEYLDKYADKLFENFHYANKLIQRLMFILLSFMFAFELLARSYVGEIVIGPFKINNLSLIIIFLPVVMAYFQCALLHLLVIRERTRMTIEAIFRTTHKEIEFHKLHWLLFKPSVLSSGEILSGVSELPNPAVITFLPYSVFAILTVGGFVFDFHAYYSCFLLFGMNTFSIWLSLLLTTMLLLQTVMAFLYIGH